MKKDEAPRLMDWVVRRPRHPALLDARVVVEIVDLVADPITIKPAHLIDISLTGAQLGVDEHLPPGTPVEVRIYDDKYVQLNLTATVQWNRHEGKQLTLGCEFAVPLKYEELGELFLTDVLTGTSDSGLSDAR